MKVFCDRQELPEEAGDFSASYHSSPFNLEGARRKIRTLRGLPKKYLPAGTKPPSVTDKLTPERRSWNMSRIRSRDTGPELKVRSLLHGLGFRFRLHLKHLPGKPDIVLPKYKTVVFVHGCYWHSHGCKDSGIPKTNSDFWIEKLNANRARDVATRQRLEQLGWNVCVVWECELKNPEQLIARLSTFLTGATDQARSMGATNAEPIT